MDGKAFGERYARHFVLDKVGVEGQKKLSAAKVLVVGAGGLASAAIPYLAGAGVGTLGVADFDCVALANLQRQIIHRTADVGENKAVSAARFISELNPEVETVVHNFRLTPENIGDIIAGYDFVLDCVDRFENKFLINDACVLAGKPFCHAGVLKFSGQIFTYVPHKGFCLRCLLGEVPDGQTCAEVGVLGAAVGVFGTLQAAEAIKYIVGAGDLLTGRVLNADILSMKFALTPFPADPDCVVCGKHATICSLSENSADYNRRRNQ